jgi:Tol biopolymer transport system component
VATLIDLTASPSWRAGSLIRPAPDGNRIAYTCADGKALCLYDRVNAQTLTIDLPASELAWAPDGSQLAVMTEGTYGNASEGDQSVRLTLVGKDGQINRSVSIAPNGRADAPHWTPDARRVVIQTYPYGGRRILVCDVAAGELVDLSQPRWDAWFALSPDGRRLLLNNGWGDFWIAQLEELTP